MTDSTSARVGDADRWRRIEQLLDLALDSDPAEWSALLEAACGGDAALKADVEALLARRADAQRFLTAPPAASAAALLAEMHDSGSDRAGRIIGAYSVVRELGRGGMSRVFLAERADGHFEQQVALKLLRPGLDADIDRDRFRAERQILASLDHPNIARLLDGGVTIDGQPYLVLEYVAGQPIDRYCDERSLPVRDRLRLFITICEAVQYAHRNLVVHRDLKPSNILVTPDGVVKLLDFGLAKLLEPSDAGVGTPTTRTGHRWMTPEYAAPEQVRGGPITTQTDVHQLGAVLYELLTGEPPFGRRGDSPHSLEEDVLHRDAAAPSAALAKRTSPSARGSSAREVRGDLDAIALKALRKEPIERYTSAHELSAEIGRHLAGQPVLARGPNVGYRVRRFTKRHRLPLGAALVIVALLGAYGWRVFADRARIRGALAEATLGTQRAEQVTDLMLGLFQASEGGKALSDSVTARELLDRGLARAHELSGQPALQAQMLDAVGRIYTQLGDYAPARATLLEALAIRRRIYGSENVDVLTSLESLGDVADKQETPDDVSLRREAFTLSRRLSGDNDPRTIDRMFDYAVALHRTADYHAADSLFDVWMAAAARQPTAPTAERADRLALLASFLQIRGQFARAEPMLREALAIRRSLYGERHSQVGEALTDLGIFYDAWRKEPQADTAMAEALDIMRAAYPNGHPRLASIIRLRAIVYEHSARFQEAEPLLRESLGMRQRLLGPNSLDVASVELDLAFALNSLGNYDEALALARHATGIYSARFDPHNAMLAFAHIHVGDALRGLGHYAEAEPILLAAFTRFEKPNSVTRQWRGYAAASLARLYEAEGRAGDAEKYRALVR